MTYNLTTSLSESIIYRLNDTSTISDVYPEYGSIEGGTTIKITGINLAGDILIFIDEIECPVINGSSI